MGAALTERQEPSLNSSQEMSGLEEGFRRRTAKVFKDWHDAMVGGAALKDRNAG